MSDPRALTREVNRLESVLQAADSGRFTKLVEKSKQLAHYMNTGEHGPNLLRNAYAVAHLFGERGYKKRGGQSSNLVQDLDKLISLYALQENTDDINQLITDERAGVAFAMAALQGNRTDEINKINSDLAQVNHYKGHIPSENQLGTSLIVAHDSEHARLVGMGYSRIDAYKGSSAENVRSMSYYFTPVSGRATFNQGVLQTVHQTVSGIDPRTGFTSGELTAGQITDPQSVTFIERRIANQRTTNENLLPVYDDLGNVTAFERGINPAETLRLNKNTNLAQMIGAWRGRQAEEHLAKQFNYVLIDNLHDIYSSRNRNAPNEFIDLANSTDPVHQDVWKLIPADIKDYIKSKYGRGFYIRKDMINDAVGFRQASVGDVWTGNSRLKPVVADTIKKAATGAFGGKAYTYLVNSEKFTQNLVSDAKVLIVIKSFVIPAANLVSNSFQLLNRGVPARSVIKGLGTKTTEINDFIKRRHREVTLDAELLAAKGSNNLVQIRKIETELQSIKDSYRNMSIWPLIEAGEFSAISDGGITQEDLALANGRWSNFVEKITNKLPDGLNTVGKYALVTRDTALFQGLTRAVQYGDFIGKAILYEDLVKRKKMKSEEALAQISESFVNYNRLAGRTRNYAESIGLIWFWNFKLRIMKEANYLIRNHPFRTLMLSNFVPAFPIIGSIGNPVEDNFATILADGKLGWSMGWGMGLNAPQLNPWLNAFR